MLGNRVDPAVLGPSESAQSGDRWSLHMKLLRSAEHIHIVTETICAAGLLVTPGELGAGYGQ